MKKILLCLLLILSGCQKNEPEEIILQETLDEIASFDYEGSCDYISDWYYMYIPVCKFNNYKRPALEDTYYQEAEYNQLYDAYEEYQNVFFQTIRKTDYKPVDEQKLLGESLLYFDYISDNQIMKKVTFYKDNYLKIALNGIEEVYYYTYDSDAFHQAIFDSHVKYIDTLRDVEERSKQYRDLDEENRVKKLAYLRQMLTKVTEEDYNQVCECIDEWQINDSISNECNFNYIKRPSKEESIYQNADYELYYQAIDDYEKVFKDTLLNLEYTWLEEKPELDINYMSDYILMMFFNDMEHYVVNARLEFYEEGIIRLSVQGNFYLYYQYDADAFMKTISDAKAEMNKIHDDISRKYN